MRERSAGLAGYRSADALISRDPANRHAAYPNNLKLPLLEGPNFVGVLAETREAAWDALELVDVVYEALPAVINEEAAIAEGAPQLHENVPNNITTYFKTDGGDYAAAVRGFTLTPCARR